VLLTTDAALRSLNRRFRGKNKPTDVLSFPAAVLSPERIAGDLAISVETARHQAAEQDHALAIELKVLILHGLLHLAGYDHESDSGRMARRERSLRAQLRLPQGLIERAKMPATAVLKGHGFNRAVNARKNTRAFDPEGSSSKGSPATGRSRPSTRRRGKNS
jgi:probable rRNA maturation factor